MSGESKEHGGSAGADTASQAAVRARPGSIEERRRLVAESLQVGNPGNRAKALPEQADPKRDCQIELRVEDIRPYEHNPRRANNAKFAEIKESIRATGIRNPLTVTRRPGEKHFIVEAGGNTRLLAVQQLWAETQDPRFEKLTVLFRPWRSESHVLTAHLIENEQRGELTFWDKANGIVALKAQFEEDKGRTLSMRQLEQELNAVGFSVSTTTLGHYLYATTRLRTLGEAIPVLSYTDVKAIHPRLNLIKRYGQRRGEIGEAVLYSTVFEPVFRRYADDYREHQTFNPTELCQACEDAFAQHLGESVARLRMVLDALAQSPQAPLEALPEPGASTIADLSTPPKPAISRPLGDPAGVNRVYTGTEGTDGHDGQRKGETPPTRPEPGAALLARLKASVGRLAQMASLADCLRAWEAAPLGYYMEAPPTLPAGEGQQRLQQRGWWLLALVSRQFNESVRRLLPDASGWRRLCPSDGGSDKGVPHPIEGEVPAPTTLDAEFFEWLLDGHDEMAATVWEIVNLARELRSAVPHRLATSAQPNTSTGKR